MKRFYNNSVDQEFPKTLTPAQPSKSCASLFNAVLKTQLDFNKFSAKANARTLKDFLGATLGKKSFEELEYALSEKFYSNFHREQADTWNAILRGTLEGDNVREVGMNACGILSLNNSAGV